MYQRPISSRARADGPGFIPKPVRASSSSSGPQVPEELAPLYGSWVSGMVRTRRSLYPLAANHSGQADAGVAARWAR